LRFLIGASAAQQLELFQKLRHLQVVEHRVAIRINKLK
jgi:hypothetical protein